MLPVMRQIVLALLVTIATVSIAHADGGLDKRLTSFDKDRLARFDSILAEALAEASAGGTTEDLELLNAALAGAPLPLAEDFDPTGDWKCRTIKAGGGLPLVVYGWFKCRITDDGAGWMLEKLTGSQRTRGRFYTLSATRLAYVGAGHVAGDKARNYGDDPKENQVAIAERRGDDRIVLLFPAPQYESKLDVLVLEK
jgi:hypothetical protein